MTQERYLDQTVTIFLTNFTQKASLFRGMSVNPLLLLHYLMKISIVIHQTMKVIFQLHSGKIENTL